MYKAVAYFNNGVIMEIHRHSMMSVGAFLNRRVKDEGELIKVEVTFEENGPAFREEGEDNE